MTNAFSTISLLSFDLFCRLVGLAIILWLTALHLFRRSSGRQSAQSRDHEFCSNRNCLRCSGVSRSDEQKDKARRLLQKFTGQLVRLERWIGDVDIADALRRPTVFYLPDVKSSPLIARDNHENDVKILEANWKTICEEFDEILIGQNTSYAVNSTPEGCWRVWYLYNQGVKNEENCRMCPMTVEILNNLTDLMVGCSFGNVCFTVVEPGTTITAHYGPCNVRSRCHLGLKVPPGFKLNVGETSARWKEGECLLFDDSYLHSVESDEFGASFSRIVLMVDLWHYDLSIQERKVIRELFPIVA